VGEASGISKSYFSDILHGGKRCTPDLAKRIAEEATKIGLSLSRFDLLYPDESNNVLMEEAKTVTG